MSFDELQSKWKSHDHGVGARLDPAALLKDVQREQRKLDAILLRRDFNEIGVGLVMAVFFFWRIVAHGEWVWISTALACMFVGIFLFVDRRVQSRRHPPAEGTLLSCLQNSLVQVEHQIWLLQNVFWWYLLPLGLGIAPLVILPTWQIRDAGLLPYLAMAVAVAVCLGIYWGIYRLNQQAVKKCLEPRRAELVQLLASFEQPERF